VLPEAAVAGALTLATPITTTVVCASKRARDIMAECNPAEARHQLASFWLPTCSVGVVLSKWDGTGADIEQQFWRGVIGEKVRQAKRARTRTAGVGGHPLVY
jgi:hypothetical protein